MRHDFVGKESHAAEYLLVRNLATHIEPTQKTAHAEFFAQLGETVHKCVWGCENTHHFTDLLVGGLAQALCCFLKKTVPFPNRKGGDQRVKEMPNARFDFASHLFGTFRNVTRREQRQFFTIATRMSGCLACLAIARN